MPRKKKRKLLRLSAFIMLNTINIHCAITSDIKLKMTQNEQPTLLFADKVSYQNKTGLMIAEGNVEIEQGGRLLRADLVTYHEKKDEMMAQGHVQIREKTGEILYFDKAKLSGDLKNGFIKQIRLRFEDGSRLIANQANRLNAEKTFLDQVLYSACKTCKTDPNLTPFWQLKADHAIYDEKAEDIFYENALIEILGIPVLYTPYLRHPAPQVKSRQGILSIIPSHSTQLGLHTIIHYYVPLAVDKDLTFTPLIRANAHGAMLLQYCQKFTKGEIDFKGSMAVDEKFQDTDSEQKKTDFLYYPWHIFLKGRYDLTSHIRLGANIERANDRIYLQRYPYLGLSSLNFLTTRLYGEGFWGRNYLSVEGYSFQGLRKNDTLSSIPVLFPWVTAQYLSKPDILGGRWSLDSDALILTRPKGSTYGRFSPTGGWQKIKSSSWGDILTFGAKVRSDLYQVNNYQPLLSNPSYKEEGLVAHFFPQLYGIWNMPFFKMLHKSRLVIDPIVGVNISPHLKSLQKIPNEDCQFFELDDINIMSESRFAGLDRIDSGSRLNYGVNFSHFHPVQGNANFFIGQSIAFQKPQDYLINSDLDKKVSDIVLRLKYNYRDWFSIKSRSLFDQNNFEFRRHELSTTVGQPTLRIISNYIQISQKENTFEQIINNQVDKQIHITLSSVFHKNWAVGLGTIRNIGRDPGTLMYESSLVYRNECIAIGNTLTKTFYQEKSLEGLTYMIRISFKNLGYFSQNIGATNNFKSKLESLMPSSF